MRRLLGRWWPWLLGLMLLGGGGALAWPHLWAWRCLEAGRDAVARFHGDDARADLDACLAVWPSCVEAHLLDARAARLAGDFPAAEDHLRAAQRLQEPPSDALVREWAMFHVAAGELDGDAEDYLRNDIRRDPEPDHSAPAREALAEGRVRMYRVLDALTGLKEWLDLRPHEVQALELRGDMYWQMGAVGQSADDYQQVVELDPSRRLIRERLATGLIEKGRYADALKQLTVVRGWKPDDPHIETAIARCCQWLGRPEEARRTLDGVLARHSDFGPALLERGRTLTQSGRPAEAEDWLRRAVKAMPFDYQANFALADALEKEGGKADEAKAQRERADRMYERDQRLMQLTTHDMNVRPRDAELRCEIGRLFLERGNRPAGEVWLLSALQLNPHYRPAHEALARFYQEQGDDAKARDHRREAQAE